MSDAYSTLVDKASYLVGRKAATDIATRDRWSQSEIDMIKPCVIFLINGGERFGFPGLDDKRHRQIEIRLASAYIDLEASVGSWPFACLGTEWFQYRLAEERKARATRQKSARL